MIIVIMMISVIIIKIMRTWLYHSCQTGPRSPGHSADLLNSLAKSAFPAFRKFSKEFNKFLDKTEWVGEKKCPEHKKCPDLLIIGAKIFCCKDKFLLIEKPKFTCTSQLWLKSNYFCIRPHPPSLDRNSLLAAKPNCCADWTRAWARISFTEHQD